MKKILALCLTVLMLVAIAVPAMAADKINLAKDANISLIGYLDSADANKNILIDGKYNTDVDWSAGNWHGAHADFKKRYNAEGDFTAVESHGVAPYVEGFPYYSILVMELKEVADVESMVLVMADADYGIGDYCLQEFDILTSDTGEAWTVSHEARATLTEQKWTYVDNEDVIFPYWTYEAELDEITNCKYIALAITVLANKQLSVAQYADILEIEVYGTAAAGATEDTTPVTEDTTPVTEDTTPVTEDTTPVTQDTPTVTPDAPATFDFVIVPAIALAAAAAGAVVLKKKEN